MAPPGTEHEQEPHHQEEEKTGQQHIRDGDCLPIDGITFYTVGMDSKPQGIPAKDIFLGKRVAVISMPRAYSRLLLPPRPGLHREGGGAQEQGEAVRHCVHRE
jgi:hypothetical protein